MLRNDLEAKRIEKQKELKRVSSIDNYKPRKMLFIGITISLLYGTYLLFVPEIQLKNFLIVLTTLPSVLSLGSIIEKNIKVNKRNKLYNEISILTKKIENISEEELNLELAIDYQCEMNKIPPIIHYDDLETKSFIKTKVKE